MRMDPLIKIICEIDRRRLLDLYDDDMDEIAKAVGAVAWEQGRQAGWDDACRSWGEFSPQGDGEYATNPYQENPLNPPASVGNWTGATRPSMGGFIPAQAHEGHAQELVQYIAPLIATQVLRDHAANLRFIANRSRQDEAVGLDQAADIAKASADELDPS